MIVAAAQRKHQMKSTTFMPGLRTAALVLAGVATTSMTTGATAALTPLADQPISIADVPANVMLALSVEFPTAITRAHQDDGDTFVTTKKYLGYFDPNKCYTYNGVLSSQPASPAQLHLLGPVERQLHELGDDAGHRHLPLGAHRGPAAHRRAQDIRQRQRVAAGQDHPAAGLRIGAGKLPDQHFPDRFLPKSLVRATPGSRRFPDRPLWIRNGGMGVQVRFGYEAEGKAPWSKNAETSIEQTQVAVYNVNVEVCRDQGTGAGSFLESTAASTWTRPAPRPSGNPPA
jgi:type IV pilus assembly protein PilY1